MTLPSQADAALQSRASRGAGPHYLDLHDGPRRLTCELVAVESLACTFTHVTLESPALAGATLEQLKGISHRLSERLTYLLEPISPIETDSEGCVVQMRSTPPQQGDDGLCYYELLVRRGGSLSLRRWQKTSDAGRANVPAQVTREVLLRLIGDFASVV